MTRSTSKALGFIGAIMIIGVFTGCEKEVQKSQNDSVVKTEYGKELLEGLRIALVNGVAVKCVGESVDFGGEEITYTDGKSYRTEKVIDGVDVVGLDVGGVTTSWEAVARTGSTMDSKCYDEINGKKSTPEEDAKTDKIFQDYAISELVAREEAGEIKCLTTGDIDFSVPDDVELIDQCPLVKEDVNRRKQ